MNNNNLENQEELLANQENYENNNCSKSHRVNINSSKSPRVNNYYEINPLLKIFLYKSDAVNFLVEEDGIRPPFAKLTGFGEVDARKLVAARDELMAEGKKFSSIEDMTIKAKLGKAAVETLRLSGCLDGMPRSEQMDMFDLL